MKVKRIGLRMRIVLVSVTLVAFLAGNSVYNVSKILQLRNAYQFLLESVMAKKNYLLELYSHLNRMMFLESEFELTLNNGYHDRAMDYLERSRQILARLDELEQNSFDSLDSRGIQELLMDFNRLRDLVSASRDKTVRKGLTRDSGLQGSLDDNARVLEEALGQYGTPEMMGDYQALRRYEKNLMIMVTEEDGEQASQVVNHLRGLIGSRFGEGGRAASLLTMVDNYMGDFDKLVTIQNELEELHSQRASLLAALESGLESRQQDVESVLEGSLNKLQQEMARNRRMAMFISGLAFLAAVAMTVLLMIRIREPMRLALESVDHLSRGDLSHKVSYGHNDEMGDIIGGINSASESLASLMKEVMIFAERGRDSSVVLAGESEDMQSAIAEIQANLLSIKQRGGELSAISGKTLSGAETINNNVYRLDTMIESLSGGIRETTAAIEQMTANIQNVSDISRKKGDTINKLLLQARENGKEIHNTSLLTGEIAGLAQGIGEIIGVINGIASRTNLLAMNAAIEAAHAGDTGRGFAVVADEIRKLAESSAENASRIGQMLGNVSQKIEQVARSSQSSTGSFEQIEDGIGSFTQSFTEITNAMEEMASGSTHVLDASQSMKGELAEVAEMAGSISEETGGIREGAESMDGQIVSLARGIDEMLTALTEISRSSRKVAESARTSLEKMEGLNGEISRFKTEEPVEELVLV